MRTETLSKVSYNYVTKKQTDLTVSMVYITPEVAKHYLSYNTHNRKPSDRSIKFLTNQMEKGLFIENGESIVFDKNMKLTDGQHRLMAIIKSGKSYHIPVVKGVAVKSMATYDTGKNRSSADILSINNYQYPNLISAFIKLIYKYEKKSSKATFALSYNRHDMLTNQQILNYCKENYDWLHKIAAQVTSIYTKSDFKVLSKSNFCYIVYMIGGKNPSVEVYEFMKNIFGISRTQDTATSYLYSKLYKAKINKEPLSFYWILGMCIKAWNYYIDGNPAVKFYKFNTEQELPKIN
ncbi:hypothetical protein [uncultured Wocania sp.]|uniref:hypothetical protein n=1 Tax=uncultured Wocania sp. TaxID=2834404 RepID=UPI0030F84DD5